MRRLILVAMAVSTSAVLIACSQTEPAADAAASAELPDGAAPSSSGGRLRPPGMDEMGTTEAANTSGGVNPGRLPPGVDALESNGVSSTSSGRLGRIPPSQQIIQDDSVANPNDRNRGLGPPAE